jgi:hypothetical protein
MILSMIENKVAASELVVLDLKSFISDDPIISFDLKDYLFRGLILKEKDFRSSLEVTDWEKYKGKIVLVFCSADVIIPVWAYMLIAVYLNPIAARIIYGNQEDWINKQLIDSINQMDTEPFIDKKVVIKGCGDIFISEAAYFEITKKLLPVVKSIMYGEPCSTVPIYKRKTN